MKARQFVLFLGLCVAVSTPVLGQDTVIRVPQQPQIQVSAHAEAKVQPDRATIHIAVLTRAATAAAAANENARIQTRVFAALRALGLQNDQLSTTGYHVGPEYRYEPNREARIIGYQVNNTIVVEVRRLEQVGPVIDAALGAGANQISGLNFYASNTEEARRTALGRAIEMARLDAEAMARAAGGTLGELLEASVGGFVPPPMPMMMRGRMAAAAEQADTPINPGAQTLAVDVTTRWRFVPAR